MTSDVQRTAYSLGIELSPDQEQLSRHVITTQSIHKMTGLPSNLSVPNYLLDPVSGVLLLDPYVAEDGLTYNLPTLKQLVSKGQLHGPFLRNQALLSIAVDYSHSAGNPSFAQAAVSVPKSSILFPEAFQSEESRLSGKVPIWYRPGKNELRPFDSVSYLVDVLKSTPNTTPLGVLVQNSDIRYAFLKTREGAFIQKVVQRGQDIMTEPPKFTSLDNIPTLVGPVTGWYWPCKMTTADVESIYQQYPDQTVTLEGISANDGTVFSTNVLMSADWWTWYLPAAAVLLDFALL